MRRNTFVLFALALMIGISGSSLCAGELLPEGAKIETIYRRGIGSPIGEVMLVQGQVYILHQDENIGFVARQGLPLFQKDTVVTLDRSRALLEMNDESRFTLASRTKLELSRSVYNPKKKERSSFLQMALGKARFFVKKLVDFKTAEFRVKTPTAVVGVRGSDFANDVTETATKVIAFGNTELEAYNVQLPDDVRLIESFQTVTVEAFTPPSLPEFITEQEAELLMRELPMRPEDFPVGEPTTIETEKPKAKSGETQTADKEPMPADKEPPAEPGGTAKAEETPSDEVPTEAPATEEAQTGEGSQEILVSEDDLIEPEGLDQGGEELFVPEVDVAEVIEQQTTQDDAQDTSTTIYEEVREDIVYETLPDFPSVPSP
jgi:hypothetical protein